MPSLTPLNHNFGVVEKTLLPLFHSRLQKITWMMKESVAYQNVKIVGHDAEENDAYQKVKAADHDEHALADGL